MNSQVQEGMGSLGDGAQGADDLNSPCSAWIRASRPCVYGRLTGRASKVYVDVQAPRVQFRRDQML